jgi:uncharacterized protein YdeI (YjbR/CyaY-like superfamily)
VSADVDQFVKRSKQWRDEIEDLRAVLLGAKLEEALKWGKPCYHFDGANIAIIQPFKACLALMFFKGALLKDARGLLVDNGPNSQSARRLEFRSTQEIAALKATIKAYVKEAAALEASGQKVKLEKRPEPVPAELAAVFRKKPKVKKAFEALTPGRQRGYILHFASAKQAATRAARIEKCIPGILAGRGLNER